MQHFKQNDMQFHKYIQSIHYFKFPISAVPISHCMPPENNHNTPTEGIRFSRREGGSICLVFQREEGAP